MIQRNVCLSIVCVIATTVVTSGTASASPGSILLKQLAKYSARESGEQSAEVLTREAGEQLAKRVGGRLADEGGEAAVEGAGRLVARGGGDVLRALDSAADPMPIIRALDDLPTEDVARAAGRLAAGASGRELSELTTRHGAKVLRAELAHPGLAAKFAKNFGDDGLELATRLNRTQATELARHADDIGQLAPATRTRLMDRIAEKPAQYAAAMGRFVRDNPGKTLFTAATASIILSNPDAFLGGFDADGNPFPGLLEKGISGAVDRTVMPIFNGLKWIFFAATSLLAAILLLRFWQRSRPVVATEAGDVDSTSEV